MKRKLASKLRTAFMALSLAVMAAFSGSADATGYLSTTVVRLNSPPVAENLSFDTYREVTVSGTLKSVDPEQDEVTYSITKEPSKGTVTLEGDAFTYTPAAGKRGADTFKYVAVDSVGNVSNEATVTVNIKKQQTKVTYSDLRGAGVQYAATWLAENDIFVGEKVGGDYVFSPSAEVTRGEFLAMCLRVTGTEVASTVTRTGFSDDGDIPAWQKPYVSAAVMGRIVTGAADGEGNLVFSPHRAITRAEAAVMLNNALGITDVSVTEDGAVPVWAAQAAGNLESVNVFSLGGRPDDAMTRADAAEMLMRAAEVVAERTKKSGLLGWAWF